VDQIRFLNLSRIAASRCLIDEMHEILNVVADLDEMTGYRFKLMVSPSLVPSRGRCGFAQSNRASSGFTSWEWEGSVVLLLFCNLYALTLEFDI
jgi:hypothetical protein